VSREPWENHFFFAEIAAYTNLQWAKTEARARGGCRRRCVDNRQSSPGPGTSYVHGEPTRPGVGSLSRKRYTQYVEPNRTGHCGNKSENRKEAHNGGNAVCYGAEKL
jgi:hypothetical protein